MPQLKVEDWPIERLKPNPKNYRVHTEEKIRHVMALLRDYGFYGPIVVAPDGTILARHSVYEAAKRLGYETVPVCVVDRGNPDKLLVADNEVARLVDEDEAALLSLLMELHAEGALEGTGWEPAEIEALQRDLQGTIDDVLDEYERSLSTAENDEPDQVSTDLPATVDASGAIQLVRFRFGPYSTFVSQETFVQFQQAWQARLAADPQALLEHFVSDMVRCATESQGGDDNASEQSQGS